MEIRINGKLLDIIPQEMSISWKSFVFADAIGDQYTTDIELPRTENNSAILQPFGVLDGFNHFQQRIRCAVSIDLVGCDGYLQISSLKRDTITAALFLSPLPYDLIDRKIRDIIHNTNYIREWDASAPTSYLSGHGAGLQRSYFTNAGGAFILPWSLRLSEFLSALSSATGVAMNFPFTEVFRVVAATPKVSPYNPWQTIVSYIDPNTFDVQIQAGQHVCTDVRTPRENVKKITITRDCKVVFTPYTQVILFVNGSAVYTDNTPHTPSSPGPAFAYTFTAGDEFYVAYIGGTVVVRAEYSNYTADDDDTDDLVFPGLVDEVQFAGVQVPTTQGGACDGQGGRVRLSWSYMDFWWCVGNITIRELINALCRLKGQPLASAGLSVGFGAADFIDIGENGDITAIRPYSQAVAAVTRLEYNEHSERLPQELRFAGDFLPETLTVYKSPFYGAVANDYGTAAVPLFEVEDAATLGYTWQDCGAVMLCELTVTGGGGTHYTLAHLPDMKWMGIDTLTDTIEADIETYTDLRGYTYCYYEGRKYVLIEADTDTDTGLCTATGLLVI